MDDYEDFDDKQNTYPSEKSLVKLHKQVRGDEFNDAHEDCLSLLYGSAIIYVDAGSCALMGKCGLYLHLNTHLLVKVCYYFHNFKNVVQYLHSFFDCNGIGIPQVS